jgi:HemK-like putative methylase
LKEILLNAIGRFRSSTGSAGRAGPQASEPPSPDAEQLRRGRVSAWEWEGGGLGPPSLPPASSAEVVFDGVTLLTSPGAVMTPRHTTEALVEWAVEWIGSRSLRVADVGTGSGAVAVAVALRAPSARVWATDDSEEAVALARANVARQGLEQRVQVLLGDLLEPVSGQLDLVLANLPYHATARSRGPASSACRDQPEHAIYAPGDGLQFNRELIDSCGKRLAAGGALAIQLYGHVLSAERGELDQLLREIEARAAEGWEARVAADSDGGEHPRDTSVLARLRPGSEALARELLEQPPLDGAPQIAREPASYERHSASHASTDRAVSGSESQGGSA